MPQDDVKETCIVGHVANCSGNEHESIGDRARGQSRDGSTLSWGTWGACETGIDNTIGPDFRGPNLRWRVAPRDIRSDREMKR